MSDPLKDKLLNYEVTPPEGVWKNLASEMNEANEFLPLTAKMYGFEIVPPAGLWSQISPLLDNEQTVALKPVRSLVYKLAAAAVVIGIILTGGIYFLTKESTVPQVAAKKTRISPGVKQEPVEETRQQEETTDQSSTANDIVYADNRLHNDQPSLQNSTTKKNRSLRKARIQELSPADADISVPVKPIRNEWGDIIQDPQVLSNTDEYVSVTGPNGQQTRISAKFIDALQYLNGLNTNSDYGNEAYYESESWQRKFQEWRNKIMQTSYIPSSTNFLDIMEFKELIMKDNQN